MEPGTPLQATRSQPGGDALDTNRQIAAARTSPRSLQHLYQGDEAAKTIIPCTSSSRYPRLRLRIKPGECECKCSARQSIKVALEREALRRNASHAPHCDAVRVGPRQIRPPVLAVGAAVLLAKRRDRGRRMAGGGWRAGGLRLVPGLSQGSGVGGGRRLGGCD